MSKIISCTVLEGTKTQMILSHLQDAGFLNSEISVLFAEGKHSDMTLEKHSKAPEGAATGGGTGVVVGSVLGWLAGIGTLAIPGIGPFIAAGPIMAALSGGTVGATVGGLIGSLIGLGIPEVEAKHYESRLKAGHSLISVHTEDEERRNRAKAIFKEGGGEDINETKDIAA